MEQTLHDRAPGRDASPADAAADQAVAVRGPIIRFCTWCKEIAIRGPRRFGDVIVIYLQGPVQRAMVNGVEVIIQDGICEKCRDEKFPETVKRKEIQP